MTLDLNYKPGRFVYEETTESAADAFFILHQLLSKHVNILMRVYV